MNNNFLNVQGEQLIKLLRMMHNRLNAGGKVIHIGAALPEAGMITTESISSLTLNLQMMQFGGALYVPSEIIKTLE